MKKSIQRFVSILKQNVEKYRNISKYIYENGGIAVFVGGIVRSSIMFDKTRDCDIEVYFIEKLKLECLLKQKFKILFVGISFGVFKICGMDVDISLPRTEKCIGVRHTDFEVNINYYNSYKRSASRRDFTINSIGYIYDYNYILDPFDGISDIQNKIIRPINEHNFIEDPLRFLRAIYFSEKLNFKFSESMTQIFNKYCNNVVHVSLARISQEFEKIFCSNKIVNAISYLAKINIPEFEFTRVLIASNQYVQLLKHLNCTNNLHSRLIIMYYYMHMLKSNSSSIDNLVRNGARLKFKDIKIYLIVVKILFILHNKMNKEQAFYSLFKLMIMSSNIDNLPYIKTYTLDLFTSFNKTDLQINTAQNIFNVCINFIYNTYLSRTINIHGIQSISIEHYNVYYVLIIEQQAKTDLSIFTQKKVLKKTLVESCYIMEIINSSIRDFYYFC